ncbi:MAG: GGDEF domain-containing protein, partial [Actinomycetota bacterium]|nr:GGDEF domain-containing protein [Actinomycetota bacterium]
SLGLSTLQNEVDRAHRSGQPFVLAFVDVDALKRVNDDGGHAAGDALLQAIAAELKSALRSYDTIVRMGGDEFVCALTNMTLEQATARARHIHIGLRRHDVAGTVSIGLAQLRTAETLESLTARGDAELYEIKRHRLDAQPVMARHLPHAGTETG